MTRGATDSTLPPLAAFQHAILRHLARHPDGDRRQDIIEATPDLLDLSEAQRMERLANPPHLRYRHRGGWALSLLKAAGYVGNPTPGIWRITDQGREVLARYPHGFGEGTRRIPRLGLGREAEMKRVQWIRWLGGGCAAAALGIIISSDYFIDRQPGHTEAALVVVLPTCALLLLCAFGQFEWALGIGLWVLYPALSFCFYRGAQPASVLLVLLVITVCSTPFLRDACLPKNRDSHDAAQSKAEGARSGSRPQPVTQGAPPE